MVDSKKILNDYGEPVEINAEEEMFLNSQENHDVLQDLDSQIIDSQTMNMFGSQTLNMLLDCSPFDAALKVPATSNVAIAATASADDGEENNNLSPTLDHLKQIPVLDPFNVPGVDFDVELPTKSRSEKTNWIHSETLSKLFVKINGSVAFRVSVDESLVRNVVARVMLLCSAPEDIRHPAVRCDNHRCSDKRKVEDGVKHHVVQCVNEGVLYVGSRDGTTYEDRLAVLVPMTTTRTDVTLEFLCQNSCRSINRRTTALVFTLEDEEGHIFGRRTFQVKICTNIKRDKQNEERTVGAASGRTTKRKAAEPSSHSSSKRPMLYRSSSEVSAVTLSTVDAVSTIKTENEINEASRKARITRNPVKVEMTLPSRRIARKVLQNAIGFVATGYVESASDEDRRKLMEYMQQLKRINSSLTSSQSSVESD